MANKIDSNATGLYIAEETSLKTLPVTPIWYQVCPNSYSGFGSTLTNTARKCIEPSRQTKKGVITDLDATGGLNLDFTHSNQQRLLQGFLFADAHEKFSTAPFNGTLVPITAVSDVDDSYSAGSALNNFVADDIVFASGFTNATNNGVSIVETSSATKITVSKTLVTEASPASTSKLEKVGFQFSAGDLALTASASGVSLTSTVKDLRQLGLNIGEFIFLGGDVALNRFSNNVGFGRVLSIAQNEIVLDETTFTPVTEVGGVKEIQLFYGNFLRNEKTPSLIKRRSYQLMRTLGEDSVGTMSEYLEGSIPNEFSLKLAQADKINADISFVAMDHSQRNGTVGIKSGTIVTSANEPAINTSSDIYRIKMSIQDPASINKDALFAYLEDVELSIANNIEPIKAIGILGAFDASTGDFEVSGSLTAFFSTIEAVQAIRNNADVGINVIASQNNKGFYFDAPLVSLSSEGLEVDMNTPIKISIDSTATECTNGYTIAMGFFNYLPTIAMP